MRVRETPRRVLKWPSVKVEFVRKSKDRPGEYLIVAVFAQPEFIEATFARLTIK